MLTDILMIPSFSVRNIAKQAVAHHTLFYKSLEIEKISILLLTKLNYVASNVL